MFILLVRNLLKIGKKGKKIVTKQNKNTGIILWEMTSREIPWNNIQSFTIPTTVSKGERPIIPKDCHNEWSKLIKLCWNQK